MKEAIVKELKITQFQLKVFTISLLATFMMMLLQLMGVHSPLKIPKVSLPQSYEKKANIMDAVRPKLEKKTNDFKLKKESSLVAQAYAGSILADNAAGYAVVDLDTGKVLAEKNGDQQLPIASITKLMTAVVALDLASPSQIFTINQNAASMPATKIGIVQGETMTLEELLHASLLTSANDATEQIREGIDSLYGKNLFIQAMNEKASFLGMKHSHFTTPQGFDYGDNYSSPEDLALLIQYALTNYPLIGEIVKKDYQFLPANNTHKQFDLYNWNGLLGVYPDIQGVKIGNTDKAGYTTAVVSTRNGKKIAVILLGAPGVLERDLWAAQLLDIGYQKTLGLPPVNVTEEQLHQKYNSWKYWN